DCVAFPTIDVTAMPPHLSELAHDLPPLFLELLGARAFIGEQLLESRVGLLGGVGRVLGALGFSLRNPRLRLRPLEGALQPDVGSLQILFASSDLALGF